MYSSPESPLKVSSLPGAKNFRGPSGDVCGTLCAGREIALNREDAQKLVQADSVATLARGYSAQKNHNRLQITEPPLKNVFKTIFLRMVQHDFMILNAIKRLTEIVYIFQTVSCSCAANLNCD